MKTGKDRLRGQRAWPAAILIVFLASCHKGYTIITEKEGYIIGKAVCANLLKDKRLYTETDLVGYINDIAYSVILESQRPEIYNTYQFGMIESKEPYIWSTIGGFILSSTRAIQLCQDEEELAALLAHTLAHHFLWHHETRALKLKKRFEDQHYRGLFIEPLEPAELEMVQKAFNSQITSLTEITQEGFALVEEMEADRLAIELLKKLGYTVHGLEALLKRGIASSGCLRTDPERMNRLKDLVKGEPTYVHSYRTRRFFESTLKLKGLLDRMLKTERVSKVSPGGKLQLEILFRNTTDKTLTGEYTIDFFDDNGFSILAEKKEQQFTVLPYEPITLRNASLVQGASQFWIDIKLK